MGPRRRVPRGAVGGVRCVRRVVRRLVGVEVEENAVRGSASSLALLLGSALELLEVEGRDRARGLDPDSDIYYSSSSTLSETSLPTLPTYNRT